VHVEAEKKKKLKMYEDVWDCGWAQRASSYRVNFGHNPNLFKVIILDIKRLQEEQ